MKAVFLEHPRDIAPEHCNDIANTPLSSCLLAGYGAAAVQAEGWEVEIIEGHADGWSYGTITDRLRAAKPALLAVHLVYQWKIDQVLFAFLSELKAEGLWKHLTAFGYYPTFAYEELLPTCPWLDSVVVGEPERTLAALAGSLAGRGDPREIPGLALLNGSAGVVHTHRSPVTDLDSLPFPLRTEASFRLPEVNIFGSRGCYGRCTFCHVNPFYGSGAHWRARSPENIVAEIDQIRAQREVGRFYFVDPHFLGPGEAGQRRAIRLATLLKPKNIRFGLEGRVNDIREETIQALVEAGMRSILVGLESGCDHALKRLGKMTTVAQNERAIEILRRRGLKVNVGFIMFEPYSSLADVRTNLAFLQRNGLLEDLAITSNVLYHHQIVLRGSPCYQDLLDQGRLDLAGPSAYEARATFADPQVAILAAVMRRITNHLFRRLSGLFTGRGVDGSGNWPKLNGMLLDWFLSLLRALESARFGAEMVDAFAEEAMAEIDAVLLESRRSPAAPVG